jgi:uncharacterized membrane protein
MGIGASVFLMAVGAIMAFAIEVDNAEGFNINTIGIILMVAGLIGLLVTMFVWGPRNRGVVVEEDVTPGRRRVV